MTTKTAIVRQVHGQTFVGKADSNHWVAMDGGSNAAISPKELLLLALGGCTGTDVASILSKKRVRLAGFEMRLTAQQGEDYPKVYTEIHLEYVFYGDEIRPKDVERAIELSLTKYCSVTAMLQKAIHITHSYRIEPTAAKEEGVATAAQS